MADEQDYPGTARTPGAPSEPDQTRPLPPVRDEAHPDGGPRSGEATGPWISDRTEQLPRTPASDGTQILPSAADATRVAGAPGPEQVWAARAEVRPPQPVPVADVTATQWAPPGGEPRRHWWMPIVIGIVVFLLLGVLGVGVWLIVQGSKDDPAPAPAPVATTATVQRTTEPTRAPTTEPTTEPTTTPPTTATTTTPATVVVPALAGMTLPQARQALDRVGLAYRLIFRPSRTAQPGTVLDSDPTEGREVPADTKVTLVIASSPSPSPSTTSVPAVGGDQPDED